MNETEDNIEEISKSIFTKPPGHAFSISLQLEEMTSDIAEQDGIDNFIFHILYLITFRGIEMLYGHKNILRLSEKEYLHIQKYVNSYGYSMDILANDTQKTPWDLMKKRTQIKSYKIGFEPLV